MTTLAPFGLWKSDSPYSAQVMQKRWFFSEKKEWKAFLLMSRNLCVIALIRYCEKRFEIWDWRILKVIHAFHYTVGIVLYIMCSGLVNGLSSATYWFYLDPHLFMKWLQFLECSWNHERASCLKFARDPKYSWFHEQTKNWIYCLYLHLIINI